MYMYIVYVSICIGAITVICPTHHIFIYSAVIKVKMELKCVQFNSFTKQLPFNFV